MQRTRPSSTTTRIKTLINFVIVIINNGCTRPSSTTTRIKTSCLHRHHQAALLVRDHLPLQQGLRPAFFGFSLMCNWVRDHLPLQQGLRLMHDEHMFPLSLRTRPSSTTTRIKTCLHCNLKSATIIQYTIKGRFMSR